MPKVFNYSLSFDKIIRNAKNFMLEKIDTIWNSYFEVQICTYESTYRVKHIMWPYSPTGALRPKSSQTCNNDYSIFIMSWCNFQVKLYIWIWHKDDNAVKCTIIIITCVNDVNIWTFMFLLYGHAEQNF